MGKPKLVRTEETPGRASVWTVVDTAITRGWGATLRLCLILISAAVVTGVGGRLLAHLARQLVGAGG